MVVPPIAPLHPLQVLLLKAADLAEARPLLEDELARWSPAGRPRVVWWIQGLKDLRDAEGPASEADRQAVQDLLSGTPTQRALLLSSGQAPSGAALLMDIACGERLRSVATSLTPFVDALLEKSLLRASVEGLGRAEKLQRALFEIADMAGAELQLDAMLRGVHEIVGGLMYAANFYIALYEPRDDAVRFIYFADTHDTDWNTPDLLDRMADIEHSLTWYLIRDGRPLRGTSDQLVRQVSGPLSIIGPHAADWLGVPMLRNGQVLGAMVVQSYEEPGQYTAEDARLLAYVGSQILVALERRQARHELQSRTEELAHEVQVRTEVERKLKHEVLHDALTGLPNRGYLRDQLRRALRRQQREPDSRVAVLFLDLDGFKQVNDREGHIVGDALLQEVAARFSGAARGGELVARMGGDEFAVLMDCVDAHAPLTLAQRLIESLHTPLDIDGRVIGTGTSVGIALGESRHVTPDDLLREADQAMYAAKAAGRGRVALFDPTAAETLPQHAASPLQPH